MKPNEIYYVTGRNCSHVSLAKASQISYTSSTCFCVMQNSTTRLGEGRQTASRACQSVCRPSRSAWGQRRAMVPALAMCLLYHGG